MNGDLSLFLLDIIMNSITAGAGLIKVDISENNGIFTFSVEDNGMGMDDRTLLNSVKPNFTTKESGGGAGLPGLKSAVERCGGDFSIMSKKDVGTTLSIWVDLNNPDAPATGDIIKTMHMVICSSSPEYIYTHSINGRAFEFDSQKFKSCGDMTNLNSPYAYNIVKTYLDEKMGEIE